MVDERKNRNLERDLEGKKCHLENVQDEMQYDS